MGQSVPHALGRNKRVFAKKESTFGTFVKPTASDTTAGEGELKALNTSFNAVYGRDDRMDARTSRSLLERITNKRAVDWSIEKYLMPAGEGLHPNDGILFEAALGTRTLTAQITINDYTQVGDTITVVVDGSSTALVENTDFNGETSNNATATNLATAIDAISGVSAAANGAVVTVTADAATYSLTVASSSDTFASETQTPQLAYTLSSSQTGLASVSLTEHMNSTLQQAVSGGVVNELTITASGSDHPKVTFAGPAKTYISTLRTTLNGALTSGTTTSFVVDDAEALHVGSVVQIGDETNSGAGYEVTAKSGTTMTIASADFSGGNNVSDEAAVVPFVPTDTTAGSPMSLVNATFKMEDTGQSVAEVEVISFELTLNNNVKVVDDELGQEEISDFIPGFREVTGTVTFRARRDWLLNWAKREDFTTQDLEVVLGTGTGTQVQIDVRAELEFAAVDVPEAEEAVVSIPFRGLASSSGEDELTITFK